MLTLLVHLGYLTHNSADETVMIPNKEVSQEYVNAISTMNWHGVMDSVEASRKLLDALWAMGCGCCCSRNLIRHTKKCRFFNTTMKNPLSCTINLAFYFAREYYTMVRELPAGKRLCRCLYDSPKLHPLDSFLRVVIELKWDKRVGWRISSQIKEKHYGNALKGLSGQSAVKLASIMISATKKHECVIEKIKSKDSDNWFAVSSRMRRIFVPIGPTSRKRRRTSGILGQDGRN